MCGSGMLARRKSRKKTIDEIKQDIKSPYVMQRLIQGDVGSGKTIVMWIAATKP